MKRKFTKLEKTLLLILAVFVILGCVAGARAYQEQGLGIETIAENTESLNLYRVVIWTYNDPVTGLPVSDLCRIWAFGYGGGIDCDRMPIE